MRRQTIEARFVRTAVTQLVKMLHDARMAALAKPHCGDGHLDGRRLWAVRYIRHEAAERVNSLRVRA